MELTVKRQPSDKECTLGKLYIDGEFFCHTLEDVMRPAKIKHETAIPAGRYEVILNFSQRFGRMMPLLLNVPEFDGVRIHYGNTKADTSGCLLVGETEGKDMIGSSRAAFACLYPKIYQACHDGKVFITISDPQATA